MHETALEDKMQYIYMPVLGERQTVFGGKHGVRKKSKQQLNWYENCVSLRSAFAELML